MPTQKIQCRATAGVVLVKTAGAQKLVFMGKAINYFRQADYDDDYWTMPQGGIDPNESPHDAVRRELFEETGIKHDIPTWTEELEWYIIKVPKHMRSRQYEFVHHQKYKWFLAHVDHDPKITLEPKEYTDCGWFEPLDAIEKTVFFKKEMYRNVLYRFGLLEIE